MIRSERERCDSISWIFFFSKKNPLGGLTVNQITEFVVFEFRMSPNPLNVISSEQKRKTFQKNNDSRH